MSLAQGFLSGVAGARLGGFGAATPPAWTAQVAAGYNRMFQAHAYSVGGGRNKYGVAYAELVDGGKTVTVHLAHVCHPRGNFELWTRPGSGARTFRVEPCTHPELGSPAPPPFRFTGFGAARNTIIEFAGRRWDISDGRYKLLDAQTVDTAVPGDYGTDPVFGPDGEPTGYVRMVPSGRIMTAEEARKLRGRGAFGLAGADAAAADHLYSWEVRRGIQVASGRMRGISAAAVARVLATKNGLYRAPDYTEQNPRNDTVSWLWGSTRDAIATIGVDRIPDVRR